MSSGCGDVLSLADLQTAKKHQIFEAEVITGKSGGVASGADIDYATNLVTGQTQKTLPAVLRDAGLSPVSWDFSTGGALTVNDRDKVVYDPVSKTWYSYAGALPVTVPAGFNPVGNADWKPQTDPYLRDDLADTDNEALGDNLVGVKLSSYGAIARTQHDKNADLLSIQDLGAISGVGNSDVDDKVMAVLNANAGLLIPAGFVYVTTKPLHTAAGKSFDIICPNGKATIKSSGGYTMFTQDGPFKFQYCTFKNIIFDGSDITNSANIFMESAASSCVATFTTHNCVWQGFHTVWKAIWIAVYHYNPIFKSVSDYGYIVDTPVDEGNFASFNLNFMESPIFLGSRARMFFRIIGGFNFTINNPWFEKNEVFGGAFFYLRQFFNFKINDGWFEYFKGQNLIYLKTDGTENTQSDHIIIDGLHINNSRADSGFNGLVLMDPPQYTGNYTDPKCVFKNIVEHNNSVAGWYLLKSGDVTNRAESLTEIKNLRLKYGQPACSDGMTIARTQGGANPDIINSIRSLSTQTLQFLPREYQTTSYRTKDGLYQQQQVVDNAAKIAYWKIGDSSVLVWSVDYVRPGRQNAQTCGTSTYAWSGGYTQTAFQITSDRSAKMDEEAIPDAVLDAWGDVQYVSYKLKASVAEKGAKARRHVGVIAQDIKAAFEAHGVDPFEYGILCYDDTPATEAVYDTLEDGTQVLLQEAREAHSGYTVRYEEVLCLEAAYMRRELSRLKSN